MGLTAFVRGKTEVAGIRHHDGLLEATRTVKGRKALAAKTGISEQLMPNGPMSPTTCGFPPPAWARQKSGWWRAAGVTTVRELAFAIRRGWRRT